MTQQYRNVNISEEQAHEYYSLLMKSDPYPGDNTNNEIAVSIAESIAHAFGFTDWIAHYHAFEVRDSGQLKIEVDNGL